MDGQTSSRQLCRNDQKCLPQRQSALAQALASLDHSVNILAPTLRLRRNLGRVRVPGVPTRSVV